ncbi:hypothetical protein HELRODRAFT_89630 [Helobdella robusta]|uniref:UDENN domain-containing protein n=1 Tax=Helobdella robusta TaxID=6412 RepID=T1G7F3_HELRO|nr:hypothetical protein HELRODRAFT_89630 [Helobdella robusta]ESN92365.1 hypothetical protein HELRODRAFT_89630 [Helobdella robusta]
MLTAVFVVAFDVKTGNIIEWQQPEKLNLSGVEFKALVSGSHNTTSDFVYFRHGHMYGLSCFHQKVLNEENLERGSRMKSVAILSNSYNNLATHFNFLQQKVLQLLDRPGHYEDLEDFWRNKRLLTLDHHHHHFHAMLTKTIKVLHPQHSVLQFLKFFGARVFVLWRLSMLGRRVIYYSPPPIGFACFWVHCVTCIAVHNKQKFLASYPIITPYFYINVADIEQLTSQSSYIACTTEKIFEMKTSLYDVFIDDGEFISSSSSSSLKNILVVNKADEEKYNHAYNDDDDDEYEEKDEDGDEDGDSIYLNYFTELNDLILSTMLEVSCSDDRQITSEHMKIMNMDANADKLFVSQLAETYAIDILLANDNPCCPI